MSRKITARLNSANTGAEQKDAEQKDIAKYFVPASIIRAFIRAEYSVLGNCQEEATAVCGYVHSGGWSSEFGRTREFRRPLHRHQTRTVSLAALTCGLRAGRIWD
jgi:hypothetical protein